MDLAEELDTRAAAIGVTTARRRQLRQIMSQATFRMRTESPGALIDEYTAKVERLRGEDGNSALALALAQKVGERQFWRYQQHLAQSGDPVGPTTMNSAAAAISRSARAAATISGPIPRGSPSVIASLGEKQIPRFARDDIAIYRRAARAKILAAS